MPLFINNQFFEKISYSIENDFEQQVVTLADQIFGINSIYLNIKRKIKGNNIGAIPDGYLIDMTIADDPKLYVVENEIVSHDPFRHIGIQMLKFVTSLEDEQVKIKQIIMSEINKNEEALKRLTERCKESGIRNIDAYLDKAVFSEFKGLVIIDEAKDELHKVLSKINANISVIELKTYKSADGNYAFEFDTLYEGDEEISITNSPDKKIVDSVERQKRRARRAECDTIVVPAKEDGFIREFLNNNQWYAIRIGVAMKERIKYIAAYQSAPVSAVTHIAKIKEIKPYKDTGYYMVIFDGAAEEIKPHKKANNSNKSPQGPVYVKREKLLQVKSFDEAIEY